MSFEIGQEIAKTTVDLFWTCQVVECSRVGYWEILPVHPSLLYSCQLLWMLRKGWGLIVICLTWKYLVSSGLPSLLAIISPTFQIFIISGYLIVCSVIQHCLLLWFLVPGSWYLGSPASAGLALATLHQACQIGLVYSVTSLNKDSHFTEQRQLVCAAFVWNLENHSRVHFTQRRCFDWPMHKIWVS